MMRWGSAVLILGLGVYVIVLNGCIVFNNISGKKFVSWVPLLGGLLAAIGLGALPVEGASRWAWVPFVIDYGCLPALIHHAAMAVWRKR